MPLRGSDPLQAILLLTPGLCLVLLGGAFVVARAVRRGQPSPFGLRLVGVGFALVLLVPGVYFAWRAAEGARWAVAVAVLAVMAVPGLLFLAAVLGTRTRQGPHGPFLEMAFPARAMAGWRVLVALAAFLVSLLLAIRQQSLVWLLLSAVARPPGHVRCSLRRLDAE